MNKTGEIRQWPKENWPRELFEIPQPPRQLRIRGQKPDIGLKRLCIVGPRKNSEYGEAVCRKIIPLLAGYPIIIVSGLAFGIDSIAHEVALENKINTIAVLGSGLSDRAIYPRAHLGLAHEIIENNGCLISEFRDDFRATNWAFPQRNRLMVGLSSATLIIEANEKSGSMITARMTIDYNHDLMAVPGGIFNENSDGTNCLIKDGAIVVRNYSDILIALGLNESANNGLFEINNHNNLHRKNKLANLTKNEKIIYEKIIGETEIDELITENLMPINELNAVITSLEVKDLIQFINGKICKK